MNNPMVLTAIGLLLTAVVYGAYIRWRKSPRRRESRSIPLGWGKHEENANLAPTESDEKPPPPVSASILAGEVRPPIREIKHMFGLYLLFGITLTTLSLFLRSEIPEEEQQWVAFPFLVLGLLIVAASSFWEARLDHASRVERIVSWLAYRLGVDLIQITCLISGVVFLILAAVVAETYDPKAGPWVFVIPLVLGIVLLVIGCWRSRLAQLETRISRWRGAAPQ
jgi:predicted membrane channel-forming protein YqfA (hemolysin III family)